MGVLGNFRFLRSSDFSCSIHINLFMMKPEHKKEASFLIFFYQQGFFKRFTYSTFAMHTYIAKNLIEYKINIWSVLWNSLALSID